MATKTYQITTEAKVKESLGITVTSFDVFLKRLTYSVTDFIEKRCSRRFQEATYTQEIYDGSMLDGFPRQYIIVKNAPVSTLTSIEYRTGAYNNPTWVTLTADQYLSNPIMGVIKCPSGFPQGYQNIRITYAGGYKINFASEYDDTLHTLPFDITDLATRLVSSYFKKRESLGRSSETFRESSINWGDLLTDIDREILQTYVRTEIV